MPIDFAFAGMAARSDISPARWRRPFLSWLDGIEAGWAIPLLLIGFIAIWLAFLAIAYLGGDLHPDVLETWTLGRTFEWGYWFTHRVGLGLVLKLSREICGTLTSERDQISLTVDWRL